MNFRLEIPYTYAVQYIVEQIMNTNNLLCVRYSFTVNIIYCYDLYEPLYFGVLTRLADGLRGMSKNLFPNEMSSLKLGKIFEINNNLKI